MGKKGPEVLTIGVAVTRDSKSHRDKLSGVLRYAATKPDWNIVIIEGTARPTRRLDAQIILIQSALRLRQKNTPTVTVDQFCAATRQQPNIFIDNRAIGDMAAEVFVRRGLSNLAAVRYGIGGDTAHSEQRADAFAAAAARTGFAASIYAPTASESAFLSGSGDFRKWLIDLPKPCGIFCFSDRQARDVLDCCRLAHLSIPNQVFIIGVDNETDICEVTHPTISSIQPDFESAGHLAAVVLDKLLSRKKVCDTYSYGILQLVERESTRPMNAGGRIVSAAMRLILDANSKPTVAGLAKRLHVSTTLLNRRFNEVVGYGPKEEIDRQWLMRIKSLLRDSSLSVAEIANLCHFAYPEELHLFFRRRTGITPSQWRLSQARTPCANSFGAKPA